MWLFISPGLYRKEKKYSIPFLLSGTALFVTGGLFAYYIILPLSLNFLIKELGASLQPMLTAVDYFSFVVIIVVGMGAVFQLPVLVAFLSLFGLITPCFLWKNFRYAVLLILHRGRHRLPHPRRSQPEFLGRPHDSALPGQHWSLLGFSAAGDCGLRPARETDGRDMIAGLSFSAWILLLLSGGLGLVIVLEFYFRS